METRTRIAALALVPLLASGSLACSSDDDGDVVATTTSAAASRSFAVNTPDGEVSMSLDGELPSNWPADFPLPDGAAPAGSGALVGADDGIMVGVFTSTQPGQDVFDYYTGQEALSPTDQRSAGLGDGFLGSMDIGGTYNGSVTVTGVGGTTYIVVILEGGTG